MARNHQDIDRIVQSCLQAMRVDGESLDSVIARYPDLEASIRPPLEAALWLDRVKYSLDPTPEFVSGARQRLLAQIQRGNVTAAPSKQFSLRDFFADLGRPQLALQFAFGRPRDCDLHRPGIVGIFLRLRSMRGTPPTSSTSGTSTTP